MGRQMLGKKTHKNFMINCDKGSRGNRQDAMLESNGSVAWEDLFVEVTSELFPEG